jgi:hypothetical protein
MAWYDFFVNTYNQFLAIFPAPLQWLITLLVVVGLVIGFINLIRTNALFLIVVVLLLPAFIPILQRFFADLYNFFLYLLSILKV